MGNASTTKKKTECKEDDLRAETDIAKKEKSTNNTLLPNSSNDNTFNDDTITILKLFGYLIMEYAGIWLSDIKTLVKLNILQTKPAINNKLNLFWNDEAMSNMFSLIVDSKTIESWYIPWQTDGNIHCSIKLIQCINIENIFKNKKTVINIGDHENYQNDNPIHKLLAFVIAIKQLKLHQNNNKLQIVKYTKENDENKFDKVDKESIVDLNNHKDMYEKFEQFSGMESLKPSGESQSLPTMIVCNCKNFLCCKHFNTIVQRFKQEKRNNFTHLCNQFFGFGSDNYNDDNDELDLDYIMDDCYQCLAFFNLYEITMFGNPFCMGYETMCIAGLLKNSDNYNANNDDQAKIVLFTLTTDTCG